MNVYDRILARYRRELPAVYAIHAAMMGEKKPAPEALGQWDFGTLYATPSPTAIPTLPGPSIGQSVAGGNWQDALATLIDAVPTYFVAKEQAKQQQDQAKIIALQEIQRGQLQLQQQAMDQQAQLEYARLQAAQTQVEQAGEPNFIPWVVIGGLALAAWALMGN